MRGRMSADYHLPGVSFSQIKNDLVASNPALASMASEVQRTHLTQPWSVYGSYTPTILQFPFPEQSTVQKKGKRSLSKSGESLQPKLDLIRVNRFLQTLRSFLTQSGSPNQPLGGNKEVWYLLSISTRSEVMFTPLSHTLRSSLPSHTTHLRNSISSRNFLQSCKS